MGRTRATKATHKKPLRVGEEVEPVAYTGWISATITKVLSDSKVLLDNGQMMSTDQLRRPQR
jgi:hypothetical protein